MAVQRVVVISDLHVSAGALDDCDQALERHFVSFCTELASGKNAVELVINGDFLDFVQAPPWRNSDLVHSGLFDSTTLESEMSGLPLCFTQKQSVQKLASVALAHKGIFSALGEFLSANPHSRLTILPGNHDADFFWPDVRSAFEALVCTGTGAERGQIVFHLDRVYHPSEFPRIWIEHGHQFDQCNSFRGKDGSLYWGEDEHPLFTDKDGHQRLYECVGTRFLIKYLNEIDESYPFVDNVKPFTRFLELFAASALTGGGGMKITIALWRMLGFLAGRVTDRPTDLLSLPEGTDFGVRERLATVIEAWTSDKRDLLLDRIMEEGYKLNLPVAGTLRDPEAGVALLEFLSDHLELLEGIR